MAKKAAANSDRSDPKKNKSLAIRTVLKDMPKAKATEVMDAVKKQYGHDISQNMVYMVKTKQNMKRGRQRRQVANAAPPIASATQWVESIKLARQLLKSAGSVTNATALVKAVDG